MVLTDLPGAAAAPGFRPKRRVYVLDFTGDSELDGAIIRARGTSLGAVLGLGEMAESLRTVGPAVTAGGDPDAQAEALPAALKALEGVFEPFLGALVSWNLVDDAGAPLPATRAGLLTLEPSHVMRIVTAWQKAVSDVPDALGKALTSGSPSVVESLTMEPLAPNRESSPLSA
jgi:hypothetical protein